MCYHFGEDLRVTPQKPAAVFDDGMRGAIAAGHLQSEAPGTWTFEASIFTSYLGDEVSAFAGYIATHERDGGDYDVYVAWRGTVLKVCGAQKRQTPAGLKRQLGDCQCFETDACVKL
jgi:hypothetical protein